MSSNSKPVIHILGLGSMGTILALDLLRFTNATVIPLLRNTEKVEHFKTTANNHIGVKKLYLPENPLISLPIEHSESPDSFSGSHIDNIVITTKTYQTKEAIQPYLPFIDSKSNLILIQNGLGVLELLQDEIFVHESNRPQLFQGVISHGVFQDSGFVFNHAGFAGMKCARLPWNDAEVIQSEASVKDDVENNELVNLLTSRPFAKEFAVVYTTYQDMLLGQLFKFLVNACINPVTSIVDAVNGELENSCYDIFTLIIDETLNVLRVAYKPLFEYEQNYNAKDGYPSLQINSVLNTENMIKEVIDIGCVVNAKNSSSMRQDTLYRRDTEIDYINGYVVHLAKKYNLGDGASKVNLTVKSFITLRLGINRTRDIIGDKRDI